jgi:cytochrome b6-f complex iron-sulfur subunit
MATAQTRAAPSSSTITAETKDISRREFLYYVCGASLALLLAESCGAITWFALPHKRLGVDFFRFDPKKVPPPNAAPLDILDGRFFLSNTEAGLFALSRICPYRGCEIKWSDLYHRFVCPCCAGRFGVDGKFLGNGPACRDLDRFVVQVTTRSDTITTPLDGGPVTLQGAEDIVVDIRQKILGRWSTQIAYCAAPTKVPVP